MDRRHRPAPLRPIRTITTSSRCEAPNAISSADNKQLRLKQHSDQHSQYSNGGQHTAYIDCQSSPRIHSSTGSFSSSNSTSPSEGQFSTHSDFKIPFSPHDVYPSDAIPATSQDFAALFPSDRKLLIHHDDATSDGNMNLRVETIVQGPGGPRKLILFHLRMHDLKDRQFSFRRYCRDSGREICHSERQRLVEKSRSSHLNAQRSLSLALSPFRQEFMSGEDNLALQKEAHRSNRDDHNSGSPTGTCSPALSDTTRLQFSNYAHIDLNKRGPKKSRRYEYEFRGTKYEWKRHTRYDDNVQTISYHLINQKTSRSIAHITPACLTARQAREEEESGGWVPPCSLQITDRSTFRKLTDVAE
jgi:hypothetical protein